jgi:hypothetical protein
MSGRSLLLLLVVFVSCKTGYSDDPAPAPDPAALAAASAAARAAAEDAAAALAKERQHREEEKATMVALADEADAEAKARQADALKAPSFRGKSTAQLKDAARRECRVNKCNPDVLSEIFDAATQDRESLRCVMQFEEDSFLCRTGQNPALCDPPACP